MPAGDQQGISKICPLAFTHGHASHTGHRAVNRAYYNDSVLLEDTPILGIFLGQAALALRFLMLAAWQKAKLRDKI